MTEFKVFGRGEMEKPQHQSVVHTTEDNYMENNRHLPSKNLASFARDNSSRDNSKSSTLAPASSADNDSEATKICPRCGQAVFVDMDTCYVCMHKFGQADRGGSDAPFEEEHNCDSGSADSKQVESTLANQNPAIFVADEGCQSGVCLWIRTTEIDAHIPLPSQGLRLGRAPHNDVVLHSRAVSRSHIEIQPTARGMVIRDLGATNPVIFRGHMLEESMVIPFGEEISVCGAHLRAQKLQLTPSASTQCIPEVPSVVPAQTLSPANTPQVKELPG